VLESDPSSLETLCFQFRRLQIFTPLMSKCDTLLDNNNISCGILDEPEVFHRKMADMLADGNGATTWTMALD